MVKLRQFYESDAPLLQEYLNNPSVTQYLTTSIPQPYRAEDADWWINEGSKTGIVRAIEYDGVFIGTVGAVRKQFEQSRTVEVGYWLAEPYWGRGITTFSLGQFSAFIFETTDIVRLQAHVFEGNHASARVLEKSGYSLEGVLRKAIFKNGKFMNAGLYALVRIGE